MNAFPVEHNHATFNGGEDKLCNIYSFKGHGMLFDVVGFYDVESKAYHVIIKHRTDFWNNTRWHVRKYTKIFTLDELEKVLQEDIEDDLMLYFVSSDYDVFIEELHLGSDMQETTYQNERSSNLTIYLLDKESILCYNIFTKRKEIKE